MPTADRLNELLDAKNELLDAKNEEIEELRGELEDAKRELELDHAWTRHRFAEEDTSGLPLPRLELLWGCGEDPRRDGLFCGFNLVLKTYYNQIWIIPLGGMWTRGGKPEPVEADGSLYLPLRIGSEILATANLLQVPAFIRWKNTSQNLAEHVEKYRKDLVAMGVLQ